MKRRWYLALYSILLLVACTRTPQVSVQVPTLAVLPSETVDPDLPTRPPTITPTVAPSLTPSPIPSPTPSPRPPCPVADWWGKAKPTLVEFLDTADVAAHTPRGSMSGVLVELRRTERTFEAFDTEPCVHDIYFDLWLGMDFANSGLTSFLGQDEASATAFLTAASQAFYNAYLMLPLLIATSEFRLHDTSIIWGGSPPSNAVATQLAATMAAQ